MKPIVVSLRSSSRHRLLGGCIVLGLALLFTAYGWYRVAAFDGPTGPRWVAWRGPDDRPIEVDGDRGDSRDWSSSPTITLGERLIVFEEGAPDRPRGFAWISPALGQGQLAWPLSPESAGSTILGLAARDAETFAVLEMLEDKVYVGIAGVAGWTVAPRLVLSSVHRGSSILLGMDWIDGELEVVLTRPGPDDSSGIRHPFEVVRLPERGPPVVTSRPRPCEQCSVQAALPTARGWKIVALAYPDKSVLLFDERDELVSPTPPELEWWSGRDETEVVQLGSLWRGFGEPYQALKDGSRRMAPALPGFDIARLWRRFALVDGVLHSRPLYEQGKWFDVVAQRVGPTEKDARVVLSALSRSNDDVLIGASLDELRPVVREQRSTDFVFATLLPRPGGYYWLTAGGAYVTLDEQLRRVDPLPLLHHLRTRGSTADHLDEPWHAALLGWVLLGLPLGLAVAALAGRLARRRARGAFLSAALAASAQARPTWSWRKLVEGAYRPSLFYAVTAAVALYKIWPLL